MHYICWSKSIKFRLIWKKKKNKNRILKNNSKEQKFEKLLEAAARGGNLAVNRADTIRHIDLSRCTRTPVWVTRISVWLNKQPMVMAQTFWRRWYELLYKLVHRQTTTAPSLIHTTPLPLLLTSNSKLPSLRNLQLLHFLFSFLSFFPLSSLNSQSILRCFNNTFW